MFRTKVKVKKDTIMITYRYVLDKHKVQGTAFQMFGPETKLKESDTDQSSAVEFDVASSTS